MGKKKQKKFKKALYNFIDTELFKWIYINDVKTKYMISNYGYVVTTDYYGSTGKMVELKSTISSNGYHNIGLYCDGEPYRYSIHRLVATYFVPNPDDHKVVNHIDGDKNNNRWDNLEWVTPKYNSNHAVDMGLTPSGELSRLAVITEKTAVCICEEIVTNNLCIGDIATKYNTTYNTVYDIYRGKSWKKISKKYDFSKYNKDKRYKNKERSTTIENIE